MMDDFSEALESFFVVAQSEIGPCASFSLEGRN